MEQQQRRARNQAFCQTSPRCNGKFTEESLIEYLILASALETCEFNKVSALDFLLSKKTALEGVLHCCPKGALQLSTEDRAHRVSRLSFVAPLHSPIGRGEASTSSPSRPKKL
jgi:hypothetical protein